MKYIEKRKSGIIVLFILALLFLTCSKDPTNVKPKNEPPPIPPTTAHGPGGPAYMYGKLKDYLRPERSATNTHLYLMNENDYTDTLLHVFVNSTDGSFMITELPVDTIDLIIVGTTFLSAKISSLILRSDHNSFHNLGPEGLWIDSTLFMVAIADSVPRPKMPMYGLLGYDNSIVLHFKPGIGEVTAQALAGTFPRDTVFTFGDTLQGLVLRIIYPPRTNWLISHRLEFFNWQSECVGSPILVQITPNKQSLIQGGARRFR
jgi:hypothetical protein